MSNNPIVKVLFVCMGNICRSPTAEGVFRKMVEEHGLQEAIHIDSAGTHAYHVGSAPDKRAQRAASNRDIDLSMLRGRQFHPVDFEQCDYILVMDRSNLKHVLGHMESEMRGQLGLFLDYADASHTDEVPDPYYGGDRGFEYVLDLIENASKGLLSHIREHHLGPK